MSRTRAARVVLLALLLRGSAAAGAGTGDADEPFRVLLHANTMVVAHGEVVALSYELGRPPETPEVAAQDYLFLYSPADADPQSTAPFRVARAADDGAYLATGSGTRRILLEGLRADVAVYFVRGAALHDRWYTWMTGARPQELLLGGRIASQPLVLDFSSRTTPLWPRVLPAQAAAAADGDSLRVAWQGAGSERSPVVQWGFAAGQFTGQAAATQQAIAREALCGDVPGWVDPRGDGTPGTLASPARGAGFSAALGVTFSAVITGLRAHAGRRIFYRVGDGATPDDAGMSRTHALRVPPAPGDLSVPFVLLAGADWGAAPGDESVPYHSYSEGARNVSAAIAAEVAAGRAHAVIAAGDTAYSDGYLPAWNTWLSQTAGFSGAVPMFLASGNHEAGFPNPPGPGADGGAGGVGASLDADVIASGGECGVPLSVLYPQPPPWSARSPWTSTRLGPACLVAVSTEHAFAPGSPQYDWLQRELAGLWGEDGEEAEEEVAEEKEGGEGGGAVREAGPAAEAQVAGNVGLRVGDMAHEAQAGAARRRRRRRGLEGAVPPLPPPPLCPWIIVVAHRPMYIDSDDAASPSHDAPVMAALQAHLDPLFRRFRVNLVISGHNHRYQRNCAVDVARGACEQRGRVITLDDGTEAALYDRPRNALHVVVGASGAPFDHDVASRFFVDRQLLGETGYARIVLVNGSHAAVDYAAPDGRVLDRFVITQQWPRQRPAARAPPPPPLATVDEGAASVTPAPSPTAVVPAFDEADTAAAAAAAAAARGVGGAPAATSPASTSAPANELAPTAAVAAAPEAQLQAGGEELDRLPAGGEGGDKSPLNDLDDDAQRRGSGEPAPSGGAGGVVATADEEAAPAEREGEESRGDGGAARGDSLTPANEDEDAPTPAHAAAGPQTDWGVVDVLDADPPPPSVGRAPVGAGIGAADDAAAAAIPGIILTDTTAAAAAAVAARSSGGSASASGGDGGKLVLLVLVALAALVLYRHWSAAHYSGGGGGGGGLAPRRRPRRASFAGGAPGASAAGGSP